MCRSWLTGRAVIPILLLWVTGALTACESGRSASKPTQPTDPLDIQTLLVAPFFVATERYEVGTTLTCSMCGAVFVTGPIAKGDDDVMTEILLTYLRSESAYSVIPPEAVKGVQSKIFAKSFDVPRRDLLLEMGRRLNADAVVGGTLFRFRQRVGGRYSAETPASVAFSLYLIRMADGRVVWDGNFDETQQALSENLFKISSFFKRGGTWLSAEELARNGLEEVMETFPEP